jgi:hypothetical protein
MRESEVYQTDKFDYKVRECEQELNFHKRCRLECVRIFSQNNPAVAARAQLSKYSEGAAGIRGPLCLIKMQGASGNLFSLHALMCTPNILTGALSVCEFVCATAR